jgi:hypothetical protein
MDVKLEMKNPSISSSRLRKSLFAYLAIGMLVLVLSLAASTILPIYGRLKAAEDRNIEHAAETRAMAINEWAHRAKGLAWQITSRTRIRQELEKYNNGKIPLNQLTSFTEPKLTDAMSLSKEILGIIRLDMKRQIVAKCGLSIPKEKWPIPDPTSKDIKVSIPGIVLDHFVFIVMAPILNREGENVGSDLVMIDLRGLNTITTNYTGLGKTSEILIGYSIGNQVHTVFPLRNQNKQAEKEKIIDNTVETFLKKGINGKNGLANVDKKVFAYAGIEDFSWGLLIFQSENELYAALNRQLTVVGLLSILIYFVFLLGFWRVMKPLAGRLLLHTEELEATVQEKTNYLKKEISTRKKAEEEREATINELRKALEKVKTLSGLIPICSHCKKIRDDKGYWNQIEAYIQEHSDALFSHSICKECAKKHYPDFDLYDD